MLNILSVMAPIILLIGLGFLAVRVRLATAAQIEALAGFVLNFALPAVILSALTKQDLRESFNAGYLAAYAAGSLVAFAGTFLAFRPGLKRPLSAAAMGALGGATSNTGFIGYPVASLALGAPALAGLPMTLLVENVLVIPLALALGELGANGEGHSPVRLLRGTAVRLARMPLMISIVLAVALSLLGLHPAGAIATTLGMLGAASAPAALFVVGGTIANLRRKDIAADGFVVVAGKLLLHPVAVSVALLLVPGVPPALAAAGILFSSVSMITIYPLLCGRFGLEKMGATALMTATVLALFTVSLVLSLVLPMAGRG